MSKIIYREFSANHQDRASPGLKEVVKTAFYQRIDQLLVCKPPAVGGSLA
ncbi:MAG: hypothetical protein LDL41_22700 [Coleofasciculus sp. S288]|nr:hypothetical protein [Coleofasciculus sp. S288]